MRMGHFEKLLTAVPGEPDWRIDWEAILATPLTAYIHEMAATQQNPVYHAEGDVWTHTKMVCSALTEMEEFRTLPVTQRQAVFLAALVHDIGKSVTTRWEDDRWTSPNHAPAGAGLTRRILWQEFGLCGTPEKQALRETICTLVRYHSVPPYAYEDKDCARRLLKIAANDQLIPDFSLKLLFLLSEADAMGRVASDGEDMRERVLLSAEMARELGCYDHPCEFASEITRYAYLNGMNIQPDQPLFDQTWGEVTLVCGLPGTGKDTWIGQHYPDLPVISLDSIRQELKISPTENQNRVIEAARECARELLRKKRPFVWNATNLSTTVRQRQVNLFTDYQARVRIVFLETEWTEELRRNSGRKEAVPEKAICAMMEKLVLPEIWEAHSVSWRCI